MARTRAHIALLLSLLCGACGSDVETTEGSGGAGTGGATATTSDASTAATGSSTTVATGSAPSSTASGTSASTGESCDGYADETTSMVTVELVNNTTVALYLGDPDQGCRSFEPFDAFQPSGGDPPASYQAFRDYCDFSCQTKQQSGGCECAADCAAPFYGKLDPDGTFETTWRGAIYETLQMPEACFGFGCSGLCNRALLPTSIRAVALAYPALLCTDDGTCDCETDESGFCQLELDSGAQGVSGSPIFAEAVWSAGDPVLRLVFGE